MLSTKQVADMFKMSSRHLNVVLSRHNELRPANRIVFGKFSAYQWTNEDVEALRVYLDSIGNQKDGENGQ